MNVAIVTRVATLAPPLLQLNENGVEVSRFFTFLYCLSSILKNKMMVDEDATIDEGIERERERKSKYIVT